MKPDYVEWMKEEHEVFNSIGDPRLKWVWCLNVNYSKNPAVPKASDERHSTC